VKISIRNLIEGHIIVQASQTRIMIKDNFLNEITEHKL